MDRAVLQQLPSAPELGAADAFAAAAVHQIRGGGTGKAVALLPALGLFSSAQHRAETLKTALQPVVQIQVGPPATARWLGQSNGIAKVTAVQHCRTAAGAPHHR